MFESPARYFRISILVLTTALMIAITPVRAAKSAPQAPSDDASANWSALSDAMKTMHRSVAEVSASKDSDLNFVNLMLPHHQAAVDMAKAQLQYGVDPQMRRLAQEIVTDQQSEMELMRLWLKRQASAAKPLSK
jgi:uncharacterized protein (DUF305 family)